MSLKINPGIHKFTVTIDGGTEEYFNTLRSLLKLIAAADTERISEEEIYRVAYLAENMLPAPEQCPELVIK
jgi:hypothetical protein